MRAHGHTHTHACAHTRPAARPCPTPRARRGGAGSRRGRAPRSRSARDRRRRASVLCRRGGPGAEAPQTEPPRFLSARTAGLCAAGRRDGAPGPGGPRPTHDPRPQPSRASSGRRLLSQQLRLGGGMGGEADAEMEALSSSSMWWWEHPQRRGESRLYHDESSTQRRKMLCQETNTEHLLFQILWRKLWEAKEEMPRPKDCPLWTQKGFLSLHCKVLFPDRRTPL
ncbi:uncharacterized protein LOC100516455 isoform X2 [Sus scrofa]|uniref:uncharacterized protein LOC100516455 isoform X2 n=1 Tax=Sus scrofa TaxID=9823 RepID=UPI000A2B178C|nr:uncharacterized protein LOC100516455 isoform X2 [Sus scrofa]